MLVRRERSACPSNAVRRDADVSPEKMEDVVDTSVSRSREPDAEDGAEADDEDVAEGDGDRPANTGRGKGK